VNVVNFLTENDIVMPADTPDGGSIALQAVGEIAHTPAGGNRQNDPGMLHLEPGQAAVMCEELQERPIGGRDSERAGSAATHEDASDGATLSRTDDPNLVHDL